MAKYFQLSRFTLINSDEYTTATDSDSSEEPVSVRAPGVGVQFVKPRIYETGGGVWKKVADDTDQTTPLTLEDKLKRWGISQNSKTSNEFGKTQTLQLNHKAGSGPQYNSAGMKRGITIDPGILRRMQAGTKLVNSPQGSTGGVQTVDADDDDFTDPYAATAQDVYVPGEYEERDHTGRSDAQIKLYRTNVAFLNRVRPEELRQKRNMSKEEVAKWLPDINNGRSHAENMMYIGNKQRLAAIKAKCQGEYEAQLTKFTPKSTKELSGDESVSVRSESTNPIGKVAATTKFQRELMQKYQTFDTNDPFLIEMDRARAQDIENDRILEEREAKLENDRILAIQLEATRKEEQRIREECLRKAHSIMAENERRAAEESIQNIENDHTDVEEDDITINEDKMFHDAEEARRLAIKKQMEEEIEEQLNAQKKKTKKKISPTEFSFVKSKPKPNKTEPPEIVTKPEDNYVDAIDNEIEHAIYNRSENVHSAVSTSSHLLEEDTSARSLVTMIHYKF